MDAKNKNARRSRRGWTGWVGTAATVATLLVAAGAASANEYTGMLAPGTIGVGGASAASGGFVYGSYSWTTPSGTNFNGFAYTGAAFSVVSDNSVGGISVGFGGDGTANQPNILFPWTDDCSITNTGHYWTHSSDVAGTSGKPTCSTGGNTSGWNYTNAEIDNTAPGADPQTEYHTLWFTAYCQGGTCNYDSSNEQGSGSGSVTSFRPTSMTQTISRPAGPRGPRTTAALGRRVGEGERLLPRCFRRRAFPMVGSGFTCSAASLGA